MNLYDTKHNLILSTYNEETNHDFPYFDFNCEINGIFYVEIKLKDNCTIEKTCASGCLNYLGKIQ